MGPDLSGEAMRKWETATWLACEAEQIARGVDPIIAGEVAWRHIETGSCPALPTEVLAGSRVWAGVPVNAGGNAGLRGQESEGHLSHAADSPEAESADAPAKAGVQCVRCGVRWTGQKPEHCTSCCRTFGGTEAGDRHRLGRHGVDRRCGTDEELCERGLVPQEVTRQGITWTQWGRAYGGASTAGDVAA